MDNQLFIPEKINVGYVSRDDTYTGKLAFVVYYDTKGVLRQEKSWNGWRDKKIPSQEFLNTPVSGFVLNKDAGGARHSYGWNARIAKVRTYDPRDFEFEMSIPNLLFILKECDCSKGKGLEGKFVYAWSGSEIVLLPEGCAEYQNSQQFTNLKTAVGVKAKDIVLGATYFTKKQEIFIYLGKFDSFDVSYTYRRVQDSLNITRNTYVFLDTSSNNYVFVPNLSSLANRIDELVAPDYAELVDGFISSKYGSKIVSVEWVKQTPESNITYPYMDSWYVNDNGHFNEVRVKYNYSYTKLQENFKFETTGYGLSFEDGKIKNTSGSVRYYTPVMLDEIGVLVATLESGAKYRLNSSSLGDRLDV